MPAWVTASSCRYELVHSRRGTVERIESQRKERKRVERERMRRRRKRERRKVKKTDNRSRLALPSRASTIATFSGRKTDPEPPADPTAIVVGVAARALEPTCTPESEQASERRGRARGSERRGARERFFGPENVRRGCQPGYLVQHSPRCEARSLRRT